MYKSSKIVITIVSASSFCRVNLVYRWTFCRRWRIRTMDSDWLHNLALSSRPHQIWCLQRLASNQVWHILVRKVNDDVEAYVDKYLQIWVPNGLVISVGRFRILYYSSTLTGLLLGSCCVTYRRRPKVLLTTSCTSGWRTLVWCSTENGYAIWMNCNHRCALRWHQVTT